MEFNIEDIKQAALSLKLSAKNIDKLVAKLIAGDAPDVDAEVHEDPIEEVNDEPKPTYSFYALIAHDPNSGISPQQIRDLSVKVVKFEEQLPGNDIPGVIDEGASIYHESAKGKKQPLDSRFDAIECCTSTHFADTGLKQMNKKEIFHVIPILNELGGKVLR